MSVWRGDCQLSTKRIVTVRLPPCPLPNNCNSNNDTSENISHRIFNFNNTAYDLNVGSALMRIVYARMSTALAK